MKPVVAIVGRPNVGKSTFFNKVLGRKFSIIEDRPGITRDRVYGDCEWAGYAFTLIDTGGLEIKSKDEMFSHIKVQAQIAVENADIIIFLTDYKTGLIADDINVASFLRKFNKHVILGVNKVDKYREDAIYEYYSLGFSDIFAISSESGSGVGDLLDCLVKKFDKKSEADEIDDSLKITIIGKPNAGKSSLVNKILKSERCIVSAIPGTTRDTVDTKFELSGKKYTIIDTAGIRKKSAISDNVEYYSVIRALKTIEKCDVCVICIDASEEATEQDIRLCGYAHEHGKPSVIVVNKWDLIEKNTNTINEFEDKLKEQLKFMDYFKSVYISALTGKRVEKVIELCDYVFEKTCFRVSTGILNEVIFDAASSVDPPTKSGRRLKILYSTQAEIKPPCFVIFVNDATLMHFSYRRYLENKIRSAFSLDGTPIKLFIRNKDEESR
ncbi:MAG: ribosome biogenesis GTPase Der [Firmicutes bacterium]|nr:ribosome biogenesis GTPase Der [Bacillota bacterium]